MLYLKAIFFFLKTMIYQNFPIFNSSVFFIDFITISEVFIMNIFLKILGLSVFFCAAFAVVVQSSQKQYIKIPSNQDSLF